MEFTVQQIFKLLELVEKLSRNHLENEAMIRCGKPPKHPDCDISYGQLFVLKSTLRCALENCTFAIKLPIDVIPAVQSLAVIDLQKRVATTIR